MVPPPSAKQGDMELMLKEMEEGGVTLGVVPGRQANAFMGNAQRGHRRHRRGLPENSSASPGSIRRTAPRRWEEIERFVVNGPLKAVGMEPGVLASPMYADDRRIYPIYEYCAEHGIPVLLMGGGATARIPATATRSSSTGVRRLPRNDVINTHGGYPWVTEILFVAFKRPNLYLCPDMYMQYARRERLRHGRQYLPLRAFPVRHGLSVHRLPRRRGAVQGSALQPEVLPNLLYRNAIKALKLDIPCGNNPPGGTLSAPVEGVPPDARPLIPEKSRRRKAFPPEGFAAPSCPAVAAFTEALCPPHSSKAMTRTCMVYFFHFDHLLCARQFLSDIHEHPRRGHHARIRRRRRAHVGHELRLFLPIRVHADPGGHPFGPMGFAQHHRLVPPHRGRRVAPVRPSGSVTAATVGRVLIGVGMGMVFVPALRVILYWFPPARHALGTGLDPFPRHGRYAPRHLSAHAALAGRGLARQYVRGYGGDRAYGRRHMAAGYATAPKRPGTPRHGFPSLPRKHPAPPLRETMLRIVRSRTYWSVSTWFFCMYGRSTP